MWSTTLAIVATLVLAPAPAFADEVPVAPEPVVQAEPAEEPAAPEAPAPVAEPAPLVESLEEPAPVAEAPVETPVAPAAGTAAAAVAPAAVGPVASAFVPGDFTSSISPSTLRPGEDFTITVTGCPFIVEGQVLQLLGFNPVSMPGGGNVPFGDDVLGGLSSGLAITAASDPTVVTYTVALDAPLGTYRIRPFCNTRESVDDPLITFTAPELILTVVDAAPPAPSETISPASGYAGDQFTANIENCPTGLGTNGLSLNQSAGDHSGPTPFLTAFDFVSIDATVEPKTYTWEVTDDAAPGEYTIIFQCFTEAGQPSVRMNPMTFTVLADPAVFDGTATIDNASGYAGDEFTITGTGCPGGQFSANLGDRLEDFELVAHNATSGDDPMWATFTFTDSAAPGPYVWTPVCYSITGDEFEYNPVAYTLLERESTTPTDTTPTDTDETDSDSDSTVDQALPDTGAPASAPALFASMLAVMAGLLFMVAARRRA